MINQKNIKEHSPNIFVCKKCGYQAYSSKDFCKKCKKRNIFNIFAVKTAVVL